MTDPIDWLLASDEPWTRYRTLVDLLDRSADEPEVAVARADPRFREMMAALTAQADDEGRYTARSMYRAWKGWSFADKKSPSPWLTFLAMRIQHRVSLDTDSHG